MGRRRKRSVQLVKRTFEKSQRPEIFPVFCVTENIFKHTLNVIIRQIKNSHSRVYPENPLKTHSSNQSLLEIRFFLHKYWPDS